MRDRLNALKAERDAIPAEFQKIKQFLEGQLDKERQRLQAQIDELNGRIKAYEEVLAEEVEND
jgi:predicted  nucleic acid-binding Zn-ribbon protein